jgi:hypothetical protein
MLSIDGNHRQSEALLEGGTLNCPCTGSPPNRQIDCCTEVIQIWGLTYLTHPAVRSE